MKRKFLIDQAIVNSIAAAFQRAGVYAGGIKEGDIHKQLLRSELAQCLRLLGSIYAQPVTEETHCRNIVDLADTVTRKYSATGILRNGRFRIGVAQKALNLYLKYLWCLGEIKTPPHCPIDARIIGKLKLDPRKAREYAWTKLDDIEKYKEIIQGCRDVAEDTCLAEWELKEWGFEPKFPVQSTGGRSE